MLDVNVCVYKVGQAFGAEFAPSMIFMSPPFQCTFLVVESETPLILMIHFYASGPHRPSRAFW